MLGVKNGRAVSTTGASYYARKKPNAILYFSYCLLKRLFFKAYAAIASRLKLWRSLSPTNEHRLIIDGVGCLTLMLPPFLIVRCITRAGSGNRQRQLFATAIRKLQDNRVVRTVFGLHHLTGARHESTAIDHDNRRCCRLWRRAGSCHRQRGKQQKLTAGCGQTTHRL